MAGLKLNVLPSAAPGDALDELTIATPCEVPWDSLRGDDRVRHCGQCRQDVFNIAAMDRQEALRLITGRQGRLCLRLFRRADGTVVTADCWSRLRAARRKGLWTLVGFLLVAAWAEVAAIFVGLSALRRRLGGGPHLVEVDMSQPIGQIPRTQIPRPPASLALPWPSHQQTMGLLGGDRNHVLESLLQEKPVPAPAKRKWMRSRAVVVTTTLGASLPRR